MRWARLIARTFEHGHRAVCSGGLFEVGVDPEEHVFVDDVFVDNYLRIEQTQRALEGEQCETAGKGRCC